MKQLLAILLLTGFALAQSLILAADERSVLEDGHRESVHRPLSGVEAVRCASRQKSTLCMAGCSLRQESDRQGQPFRVHRKVV